jgi:MFS family permease
LLETSVVRFWPEGVLARNPDFRWLFGARTISNVGDGMALIALLLHVEETEEAGIAVGLYLLASTVPIVLVGPFAGTVADRTDQRKLMTFTDLGQALVYGAIALFLPPFPVLLLLAAAGSALGTLFAPAGSSSVPALVRPDDLQRANAWLGTGVTMQVVLGPLLGGAATGTLGTEGALAANSVTFLASAALLTRLPALPRAADGAGPVTFLGDVKEGFSYVAGHPAARVVVLSLFFGVAFAAVDNVALVFLARDVFDTGALGFGGLASAFGTGMLVASAFLISQRIKLVASRLFLLGMLLSGAGTLFTGLAPVLGVALVVQALAGAGNGIGNIASDTLVQQTVARTMLGRVFALVRLGAVAGSSLAALAGGFLLDLTSPRAVFVIGGAGVLAVVALAWVHLPRELPDLRADGH